MKIELFELENISGLMIMAIVIGVIAIITGLIYLSVDTDSLKSWLETSPKDMNIRDICGLILLSSLLHRA